MEEPLTTILFLLIPTLLTLFLISFFFRPKTLNLPPGPIALPIIGHLHLIRAPIHQSFHHFTTRYGPLVHLKVGSTTNIIAGTADSARSILKTHDSCFADRPLSVAARKFAYDSAGFAFAPYGQYWRFMKRLCMSELLGSRTLEQLRPIYHSELTNFLQGIMDKARLNQNVDISEEGIKLTNNTIIRMVASTTAGNEAELARKVVKNVAELIGTFNLEDHIRLFRGLDLQGLNKRIQEVHKNFDELIESLIRRKEESRRNDTKGEGKEVQRDLLDILLDVAENTKADVKLTRENIKGFILDIFTAGSDSSAATVEWALSELINHPKILQTLRDEIDRVTQSGRLINETDLSNMPYLNVIIKETMRLHPAAPLAYRQSTKDVIIDGYTIPADTTVMVNAYSTGRDPKYWEDPDEFKPDRFFEEKNANLDVNGLHFQLIPFGGGRRICPGIGLALRVIPVTLAALVQCFEWKVAKLASEEEGGKLEMEEEGGMVIYRAKPLVLVPVPRLDPLPSIYV